MSIMVNVLTSEQSTDTEFLAVSIKEVAAVPSLQNGT